MLTPWDKGCGISILVALSLLLFLVVFSLIVERGYDKSQPAHDEKSLTAAIEAYEVEYGYPLNHPSGGGGRVGGMSVTVVRVPLSLFGALFVIILGEMILFAYLPVLWRLWQRRG